MIPIVTALIVALVPVLVQLAAGDLTKCGVATAGGAAAVGAGAAVALERRKRKGGTQMQFEDKR